MPRVLVRVHMFCDAQDREMLQPGSGEAEYGAQTFYVAAQSEFPYTWDDLTRVDMTYT
jgi:hypothetical protein